MRYWSLLAAKLVGCFLASALMWKFVDHFEWDTLAGVLVLGTTVWLFCGLLFLTILDQRYRCRVCARRLRMPVSFGSWAGTLLDSASTEYICPFGHGTLSVPDAHITGDDPGNWTPSRGFWEDLEEVETSHKR